MSRRHINVQSALISFGESRRLQPDFQAKELKIFLAIGAEKRKREFLGTTEFHSNKDYIIKRDMYLR